MLGEINQQIPVEDVRNDWVDDEQSLTNLPPFLGRDADYHALKRLDAKGVLITSCPITQAVTRTN